MRRIAIALVAIAAISGTAQARDIAWQPETRAELLAVHGHTGTMGMGAQWAAARLALRQAQPPRPAPQRRG